MIKHKVRTKETQQKQFGRIMMEMLGVLALVGLLTLGFIFYQKALLADRVNRLMEDARLAGLVVLDGVYTKLKVDEETSLKGQFEQQTPYNFSAYLEGEEWKNFVVLVDSVPYDVCVEITQRHPQWAEEIIANKLQNQCLAEMDNIIGFFYNDELTNNMESCQKDSDCGECGKCTKRRCSYGFKDRNGTCVDCDDTRVSVNVSEENCGKCKNRMYSTYNGGRCLKCMASTGGNNYWFGNVSPDECAKCPNQYSDGDVCYYCPGNVDPVTKLCDTIKCDDPSATISHVSHETCSQCEGRAFDAEGKKCIKCGQTGGLVSFEECVMCGSASSASPGGVGACSACPGNVDPVTGKCDTINCNPDSDIGGVTQETCSQCSNRFYSVAYEGRCVKCMTSGARNGVSFEECMKCPHQSWEGTPGQIGRCNYCAGTVNPTTGKCE